MDELKRVGVFTKVVKAQSFSEAARQLGLAKSAVSKQVSLLEKEVGIRLLNRSTRSLSLTEAGEIFYQHCAEIVDRAEIALNELRQYQNQPTGTLRVSSPTTFGVMHLVPVIKELHSLYPMLKIDLLMDDHIINMVDEGVDVAIRIGWLQDSNLVAKRLCETPTVLFASPEYLAKHNVPQTPSDLIHHHWVSLSILNSPLRWNFTKDGKEEAIQMQSQLKSNSVDALVSMALNGLGISAIAEYVVHDHFQSGQLIPLLTDYKMRPVGLYAVYPHREHLPPKIRVFLDFLSHRCQSQSWSY